MASETLAACDVDPEESLVEKCCVSKGVVTPGGVGRLEINALILLCMCRKFNQEETKLSGEEFVCATFIFGKKHYSKYNMSRITTYTTYQLLT